MTETCPRCQYIRIPTDKGPTWQCPNCGAAYNKQSNTTQNSFANKKLSSSFLDFEAQYRPLNRQLYFFIILFAGLTLFSAFKKNELIDFSLIHSQLTQEPIQETISNRSPYAEPHSFQYMDIQYQVKPMANYELWGLVVSHNDIDGISDTYHDETSVDTKDLCVIWGDNILSNDYHSVSFSSGAWTCYFEYPHGTIFNANQLSNNHIITDNDAIRESLTQIQIGDQIHIKGELVSYQDERHPEYWRASSITRTDGGNGACEVIFANELDIIAIGNPLWRFIYEWSWKILIALLIAKTAVLIREVTQ
ncbi:hypothetical protein A9Q81_00975 [Gammaproteobacteria bacterium 42_54_T18]|nr:hypothetical protein A9Q81_00975 [Gammaproteobacteria bacterium 42_54_T18]